MRFGQAAHAVSAGILIGMWLERILIVWNTLSHSFLPSIDRVFFPTFWDWLFLFGPHLLLLLAVSPVFVGSPRSCQCTMCGTLAARGFPMSASDAPLVIAEHPPQGLIDGRLRSAKLGSVSSRPSPTACPETKQRSRRRSPCGGWNSRREVQPRRQHWFLAESRVSHSEPRLLLGFQGTKTARREGKSSPFSAAGCRTSR